MMPSFLSSSLLASTETVPRRWTRSRMDAETTLNDDQRQAYGGSPAAFRVRGTLHWQTLVAVGESQAGRCWGSMLDLYDVADCVCPGGDPRTPGSGPEALNARGAGVRPAVGAAGGDGATRPGTRRIAKRSGGWAWGGYPARLRPVRQGPPPGNGWLWDMTMGLLMLHDLQRCVHAPLHQGCHRDMKTTKAAKDFAAGGGSRRCWHGWHGRRVHRR
jgi:hypothetical protein